MVINQDLDKIHNIQTNLVLVAINYHHLLMVSYQK